MPLLETILGSNLGQMVKDVVGTFHLDPEKKAEFQAAVDANANAIALKQLDLQSKAEDELASEVEAASANIRAEAATGNTYTRSARPSFIYVMLVILLFNYIVVPFTHHTPVAFPDALFWLFGSCMLGYTGARTWEKVAPRAGK
jgi:Holin of 3TMs, for gene-transfer release